MTNDKMLELAYTSAIWCASDAGLNTIAFPTISTGAYRFPKKRTAQIASSAVRSVDRQNLTITLVSFDLGTGEFWE
jgi:O-acetyl-ADP-ribose deacetylase (regulator of RNase III)